MTEKYSLQEFDFKQLSKCEANPKVRLRLLMMAHLRDGYSAKEISNMLCCSSLTVKRKLLRFENDGLSGLKDKPRSGAPLKLPKANHDKFKKIILEAQNNMNGGRLIGEDIRKILMDEFNANYSLNGVYYLLKTLDMVWISSRSRHPKQSDEIQEEYKKNFKALR